MPFFTAAPRETPPHLMMPRVPISQRYKEHPVPRAKPFDGSTAGVGFAVVGMRANDDDVHDAALVAAAAPSAGGPAAAAPGSSGAAAAGAAGGGAAALLTLMRTGGVATASE